MSIFKHKVILLYLLMMLSAFGCSNLNLEKTQNISSNISKEDPYVKVLQEKASKVNESSFNKHMIRVESHNKFRPDPQISCRIFQTTPKHNLTFNSKNTISCFSSISDEYIPYLVEKLLNHKSQISKETLTKIVEVISQGSAQHTDSIKGLIKAGALTDNINLDYIRMGNSRVCESLGLILRNNKLLYKNVLKTNSKIYQKEALHYLSQSGMEINLCNHEIQLLANYNPDLINYQSGYSGIPLIAYLNDIGWSQWDINTAKTLMTKKNINLVNKNGVTPMHHALMSSPFPSPNQKTILKLGHELGADFSLKSKPYSSGSKEKKVNVNELILTTRPELVDLIQNGKSLHSCFKTLYTKLDKILSPKEKKKLKNINLYSNPRIHWLEKKLIKTLPLPNNKTCIKEYFEVIDEKNTNIMASRVIDAYKNNLNESR